MDAVTAVRSPNPRPAPADRCTRTGVEGGDSGESAGGVPRSAAGASRVGGGQAGRPEGGSAKARPPAAVRRAALFQSLAALLWLPQAALIASVVGGIAGGAPAAAAIWPAAGVLALGLVRAVLDAVGQRRAFDAARTALSDLRARAVAALAARSPLDAARPPAGLAASALGEQAEAVTPYFSRYIPARLEASLVPTAIFLCVLPFSWVAALVLLVAAPLIFLFMALIGIRAKAASEAQLVEMGGMNAFLLDRLRGLATIRALGAVDATAMRLRDDAERLRARTMAVLRIAFLSSAVLELFAALGVAMTAVYVGFHLLGQIPFGAWGGRLTLGEGLFILLLAPAFFEPLRKLAAVWHDRAAGEAALEALDGLAAGGVPLPGALLPGTPEAGHAPAFAGAPAVVVEGLAFRHAGAAQDTFSGFGLSVAAGEHVAVLAPSGAGKSTLLALLAGLAPADAGTVTVGGVPLTPETVPGLRGGMAWVGQKPHLFAGTLAGNIALGRSDVDHDRVAGALAFAALDALAARRPGAALGEGGGGLSGGEGLRLALARAAARPVGLILADEPTAHLDAATAAAVTDGLLALAEGRTLIVATHDPVLAARMDRVVRLAVPAGAAVAEAAP